MINQIMIYTKIKTNIESQPISQLLIKLIVKNRIKDPIKWIIIAESKGKSVLKIIDKIPINPERMKIETTPLAVGGTPGLAKVKTQR